MTELQMNITRWEGSDVVKQEYKVPPEGLAYCKIIGANYDKSTFEYSIRVHNLNTDSDMLPLKYWTKDAGENGSIEPNRRAEGTLISLGEALFGVPVGIPHPKDLIGGVVLAEIKHKVTSNQDGTETRWARVYHYESVPAEIVRSYGSIVQFSSDEGVVAPAPVEGAQ